MYCHKLPKSSKVINGFPKKRHSKHEAEWPPVSVHVPDANARDELTDCHYQKVQVHEESELLKQHQRQECENVVFL